jgi:hypothetical protein
MTRLSTEEWLLRLMLVKEHEWLLNRPEGLSSLLGFCKDKTESDLICELLNRFFFLYQQDMDQCWQQMINQIFNVWNLDHDATQIVAMAKGADADSSQLVLQMLKGLVRRMTGKNATTKNTIDASLESVESKPCVVIVDEFVGSGDTVKRRIKYLRSEYDKKQISSEVKSEIKIYVCVVAAMEHALPNFQELADDVFAVHRLKKGISGYNENPQLTRNLETMLQMESRLEYSPDSPEAKHFPFGYKKSEALYGVDGWNAVNNLFPVFWWDKLKGGKRRTTLFVRAEDVKD